MHRLATTLNTAVDVDNRKNMMEIVDAAMSDIGHCQIVPNCRYGHGDLWRVRAGGMYPQWGLITASISTGNSETMFVGKLFVCEKCGYTEFFDDAPQETIRIEKEEESTRS